jgi:hypothetical protein
MGTMMVTTGGMNHPPFTASGVASPANCWNEKATATTNASTPPTAVSVATITSTAPLGNSEGPTTVVMTATTTSPPGTVPYIAPSTGWRRSAYVASRCRTQRARYATSSTAIST